MTTRSVSIAVPSLKRRPVTRSSPNISVVACSSRNFSPCASRSPCNNLPALSSNWVSINHLAKWTTVTSIPCSCRPFAASNPSRPPPMTTAFLCLPAASIISAVSSMVRKATTPSFCEPGIGKMNGWEPVAKTNLSKGIFSPFSLVTSLFAVSTPTAGSSLISVILFSSYHVYGLVMISSTVILFCSTLDSMIRL